MNDIKNKKDDIQISKIDREDLLEVLRVSNQKSVRESSFNKQKIKLEDHKKWFESKLRSKNVIMLKASIEGVFAGQVRLEIEDEIAVISISVSEDFRGRGIATRLIQAAISEAKNKNISTIEAIIKKENKGSIELFKHQNFAFKEGVDVSGVGAQKYIYHIKNKAGDG